MQVLNPGLYDTLVALFDRVLVANEGEERRGLYQTHPRYRHSVVRNSTLRSGEEYRINCPFCSDMRRRFYVSHQYGILDETTGSYNEHLVHCFNQGCHEKSDNRQKFMLMVYVNGFYALKGGRRQRSTRAEPEECGVQHVEVAMPSGVVPLDQLGADHAATKYLIGRGFDPNELWTRWKVGYCDYDPTATPILFGRIVIPVYQPQLDEMGVAPNPEAGPVLAGWLGRVIGAAEGDIPKYLFCKGFRKSNCLYGLSEAIQGSGPVVVCEGATDVWRLQMNAVALLGKAASLRQTGLLQTQFRGRPLVVLLDRDALSEAAKLQTNLVCSRRYSGDQAHAVLAQLPEDYKDPGDCPQEVILQCVEEALERSKKEGNRPWECE